MSFLESFGFRQNPFPVLPLIADSELKLFVNRENELEHAISAVLLGKNLLIAGQWGIGKTSFIVALRHNISKRMSDTLFVDVRLSMEAKDSNSLLVALAMELERQKERKDPLTLEKMRDHQEYVNTLSRASTDDLFTVVEASIKELKKEHKRLIFVFDDVDKMPIQLSILAGIRDSLWKMNVVYIVTSRLAQYQDVQNSAMEPFFSTMCLQGLTEFHTKMLIDKRIRMASTEKKTIEDFLEPGLIHTVHQLSQGNPRTILHICSYAFDQAFLRNSQKIAAPDLSQYARAQISYNSTSTMSKVLAILAKYPHGLSVREICEKLEENKVAISRSRVSQILGDLSKRGVLMFEKRGKLSIYSEVAPVMEKSK